MQARGTSAPSWAPIAIVVLGLASIGGFVAILQLAVARTTFDVWGGVILAPILVVASLPALRRQAARESDDRAFRLLVLALVVKLVGSVARFYVAFTVYGGVADAARYHAAGSELALQFRQLDFGAIQLGNATAAIEAITGLVYAVIGPTKLGGFLVFSWLGFWGLFCFYRAFVVALPIGRRRAYAIPLFFLPSLVFWPSSVGKEAWLMFAIGLTSLGIARLLTGQLLRGLVVGGAGLWFVAIVRPHMAGLIAVSLAAAVVTRRGSERLRELAPLVKVASIVAVALLAAVLVVRTDRFLTDSGIDTSEGVSVTLIDVRDSTAQGGAEFVPSVVDSPIRAPMATLTVLFRPFVFEAHNLQALLTALEGTALLALFLVRLKWFWAALRSLRRQPYVVFCLVFSCLFILAYSSFANFGLLARERVQLYPLFLVLLSIPPIKGRARTTPPEHAEAYA